MIMIIIIMITIIMIVIMQPRFQAIAKLTWRFHIEKSSTRRRRMAAARVSAGVWVTQWSLEHFISWPFGPIFNKGRIGNMHIVTRVLEWGRRRQYCWEADSSVYRRIKCANLQREASRLRSNPQLANTRYIAHRTSHITYHTSHIAVWQVYTSISRDCTCHLGRRRQPQQPSWRYSFSNDTYPYKNKTEADIIDNWPTTDFFPQWFDHDSRMTTQPYWRGVALPQRLV